MTHEAFSNAQIQTQDIPSAGDIAFEPLHQRYIRLLIAESLLVWAVPSVAFTVLLALGKIESSFLSAPWAFLLPLIALPLIYVVCLLHAKHSGFAARAHDIHFKAGVIWRKRVALPFNRIQHVEIERNPIERAFGLSTLKFFTAGGGAADMKIPALGEQQATDLKSYVLKLAGEADDRA